MSVFGRFAPVAAREAAFSQNNQKIRKRQLHMAAVSIPIHGGAVLVDERDTHLLEGREWFVHRAESGLRYALSKRQRLHRLIAGASKDQMVDHVNGNGLDNRRENLRVCSHTQNMQNRKPVGNSSSRFKGVSVRSSGGYPFRASIKAFGERIYLGSFDDEIKAAAAYDRAARIFHGKFARTNKSMGLY